jgi:hypothetical protein
MATKKKIERPNQTITTKLSPIGNELKNKISLALAEVVSRIKIKHLG